MVQCAITLPHQCLVGDTTLITSLPNSLKLYCSMLKTGIHARGLPHLREILADVVTHLNSDRQLARLGNLAPIEVHYSSMYLTVNMSVCILSVQ